MRLNDKRRFKYLAKLTIFDSLIIAIFLFSTFILSANIRNNHEKVLVRNNNSLTAGICKELMDNIDFSPKTNVPVEKDISKQSNIDETEAKAELERQYTCYVERNVPIDFSYDEKIYQEYIYPLAKIIYAEGGGMPDNFQRNVGYVVLNRIDSKYYPNTLNDVFFSGGYAEESKEKFLEEKVSERAFENAKVVINEYFNGTIPVCPAMTYQSEFKQGVDIFSIGNSYFGCDERIHRDMAQEEKQ